MPILNAHDLARGTGQQLTPSMAERSRNLVPLIEGKLIGHAIGVAQRPVKN